MRSYIFVGIIAVFCHNVHGWNLFGEPRIDPHQDASAECRSLGEAGSCEFYTCLEARFPCGHDGFAVKIGRYFCSRALGLQHLLTPQGLQFSNHSTACMTSALIPIYDGPFTRCGDIKDEGVSAMLQCAREDHDGLDFCSFVRTNSEAYGQMYGMEEITRLIALRQPRLIGRLFVDGARCGATVLNERLQTLPAALNDFLGTMTDSWNSFQSRVSSWWEDIV